MNYSFESFGYEVGNGWLPVCKEAVAKLEELGCVVTQVKEKFGGLRIYFDWPDSSDPDIYSKGSAIVGEAEAKCYGMCEECGEPGTHRPDGWMRTLCDKHEEAYQKRRLKVG